MRLTVKLFASFASLLPPEAQNQAFSLEAPPGAMVGDVLKQCGVPIEECRLVIINGITHTNPAFSMNIQLNPGDTVALLPRVH